MSFDSVLSARISVVGVLQKQKAASSLAAAVLTPSPASRLLQGIGVVHGFSCSVKSTVGAGLPAKAALSLAVAVMTSSPASRLLQGLVVFSDFVCSEQQL